MICLVSVPHSTAKLMIKAHSLGRMVSSGISDVLIASEQTCLKKLMMMMKMMMVMMMTKSHETTALAVARN